MPPSDALLAAQARLLARRVTSDTKTRPCAALLGDLDPTDTTAAWHPTVVRRPPDVEPTIPQTVQEMVALPPSLALGLLRTKNVATGRLWLLLRASDSDGRGWITTADAKALLCAQASSWRLCGWRQLRNLLQTGDTLFWKRHNGRIWLRSLPKVLQALGVRSVQGATIQLPTERLLGSVGSARANVYAAFHSGRQTVRPISRATLTQLTGCSANTLRNYEDAAKVEARACYAVGAPIDHASAEQQSWQQGSAAFTLTDRRGKWGRVGQRYLAWQLPNLYVGPFTSIATQQRKRIQRRLRDLPTLGTAGNEQRPRARLYGLSTDRKRAKRTATYLQLEKGFFAATEISAGVEII